jgi:SpoVK/Ycf46/Vps4 family AAA+-type ATPase
MEPRARHELVLLLRDSLRIGGAPIEMRVRRLASLLRGSEPELVDAVMPLLTPVRALRDSVVGSPSPVDTDSRLSLLKRQDDVHLESPPVYPKEVATALGRLLAEQRASDRLFAAGLQPIRSLLLSGKPGVGKTMTAAWLAQELQLPLLTLDLASVMSSYLGKTGANVRAVLDHAQQSPCVLLLDEFDAIAKRRDDDRDVGELKRLVTVLLQAVDEWQPTSVLVAATNHGELLDPAIWRRFDLTIEIGMPGKEERRRLLEQLGVEREAAAVIASYTDDVTPAALRRAVQSAQKARVLDGASVADGLLDWAVRLRDAQSESSTMLRDYKILRMHAERASAREIAESFGISHTTVLRTIRMYAEEPNGGTQPTDRIW